MPGAELADVAGPQQQAVRRHLGLGRVVAEGGEEEVGQAHGAKDSRGAAAMPAVEPPRIGGARTWLALRSCPKVSPLAASCARPRRLAVAFDYINGFHDTANAIATSVATRALSPAARDRSWPRRSTSSARSPGPRSPRPSASGIVDDATDDARARSWSRPRSSGRSPGTSSPGGSASQFVEPRAHRRAARGHDGMRAGLGPLNATASSARSSSRSVSSPLIGVRDGASR